MEHTFVGCHVTCIPGATYETRTIGISFKNQEHVEMCEISKKQANKVFCFVVVVTLQL